MRIKEGMVKRTLLALIMAAAVIPLAVRASQNQEGTRGMAAGESPVVRVALDGGMDMNWGGAGGSGASDAGMMKAQDGGMGRGGAGMEEEGKKERQHKDGGMKKPGHDGGYGGTGRENPLEDE